MPVDEAAGNPEDPVKLSKSDCTGEEDAMPSGTIGFKVNCGSNGSPGVDQLGKFTLLLSFKFSDVKGPIFIDVDVNGQSESGSGDGDDTPQVAESAQAAVDKSSKVLGAHSASVSVEVDGGGPGNALGRIVVDDPNLESVDVSDNVGGKLDTEVVFLARTKGPPKKFDGPLPDPPKGQGGWIHTTRSGTEEKAPPPGSGPTAGSKGWQFLNPSRDWHRPGPYERRPKKQNKNKKSSANTAADNQGMILLGGLDAAPGSFVDLYVDLPVLCIPFAWDSSSQSSQLRTIRDALIRAGIDAKIDRDTVVVAGLNGDSDAAFGLVGARPFVSPLAGVRTGSFPWDLVAGARSPDGRLFVGVRPSPLVSMYTLAQVSAVPLLFSAVEARGATSHLYDSHPAPIEAGEAANPVSSPSAAWSRSPRVSGTQDA